MVTKHDMLTWNFVVAVRKTWAQRIYFEIDSIALYCKVAFGSVPSRDTLRGEATYMSTTINSRTIPKTS